MLSYTGAKDAPMPAKVAAVQGHVRRMLDLVEVQKQKQVQYLLTRFGWVLFSLTVSLVSH